MSDISTPPAVTIACRLVVGGVSLQVGQLEQNSLVVDDDVSFPPSDADLIVQVKNKRKTVRIYLPHGIQKGVEVTPFF